MKTALAWLAAPLAFVAAPVLAADKAAPEPAEQANATRAATEAFRKMMDVPLKDIVGEGTMRDRMAKADPDMPEKMIIAQGVMLESMMGVMARMKDADFAAPPADASEDAKTSAAMARMRAVLPAMMDAMPGMISQVRERTAHLERDAAGVDGPASDDGAVEAD